MLQKHYGFSEQALAAMNLVYSCPDGATPWELGWVEPWDPFLPGIDYAWPINLQRPLTQWPSIADATLLGVECNGSALSFDYYCGWLSIPVNFSVVIDDTEHPVQPSAGQWRQFSVTPPAGVHDITFRADYIEATFNGKPDIYLDNLTLPIADTSEPPPDVGQLPLGSSGTAMQGLAETLLAKGYQVTQSADLMTITATLPGNGLTVSMDIVDGQYMRLRHAENTGTPEAPQWNYSEPRYLQLNGDRDSPGWLQCSPHCLAIAIRHDAYPLAPYDLAIFGNPNAGNYPPTAVLIGSIRDTASLLVTPSRDINIQIGLRLDRADPASAVAIWAVTAATMFPPNTNGDQGGSNVVAPVIFLYSLENGIIGWLEGIRNCTGAYLTGGQVISMANTQWQIFRNGDRIIAMRLG